MRTLSATFCVSGLLLAGFMNTTSDAGTEATSIDVGSKLVSHASAAEMFRKVCIESFPSYSVEPSELKTDKFVSRVETGTYFHQSLNLSFKLNSQSRTSFCSMVFRSNDEPLILARAISEVSAALAPNTAITRIKPSGQSAMVQINSRSLLRFLKVESAGTNVYTARITILK